MCVAFKRPTKGSLALGLSCTRATVRIGLGLKRDTSRPEPIQVRLIDWLIDWTLASSLVSTIDRERQRSTERFLMIVQHFCKSWQVIWLIELR